MTKSNNTAAAAIRTIVSVDRLVTVSRIRVIWSCCRGGRITVDASITDGYGDDVPGGAVSLRVMDTGCGIPPEQHEEIFDPFVQLPAQRTRTQEGTGLGLSISRDLARGMGGDLSVESSVGEGSTFTLTLPR
jgi:signal transduction histidine kinase